MISNTVLQSGFWLCMAGLFYTFAGYPLLVRLLATVFPRRSQGDPASASPEVCVVLVAFNEEKRIADRLWNLLDSRHPKLRVIVVSNGSTDATVAEIGKVDDPRIHCIVMEGNSGKPPGLNAAMAQAGGEIIVFADARQFFTPETIPNLAAGFSDPEVGAVSGALSVDPSKSRVGEGVDAYWKLEKMIRSSEALFDSSIGCTGAVYAIRRSLFEPVPEDTILDDVVIPMRIAIGGSRVGFDSTAVAFDPQPLEPAAEKIRKQRTLSGNFQMLFRYPGWLLPWRNRLWWQLISHKYLRLVSPALLLLAFAANGLLVSLPLYRGLFVLHCLFYFLAAAGMLLPGVGFRLLSLPAGFVFLNAMTVRGLVFYLRGPSRQGWARPRPS